MKGKQRSIKNDTQYQSGSVHGTQEENRRAILLLGLLAILSSVLFLQFGSPFGVEGHVGIVNLDTFLYAQYARAWADGHPYQFNSIDPPTTGCTSHLYPAILGILYWIGFKELSLFDAAFAINVVFFIVSVICFWFIVSRIYAVRRWILSILFICSGHIPLILFGLSEAGVFLCATMLTWYAVLYKRNILLGFVLFILPFIRPEGMVIVGVYGMILLLRYILKSDSEEEGQKWTQWLVLGSGIAGMLLVGILNSGLTGLLAYDSTMEKGHFMNGHWLTGISLWIRDILYMFRGIFLGDETNIRLFYLIPVFSAIFIFWGIFQLPWGRRIFSFPWRVEIWWLFSIIFTVLVISMSGYQLIHHDRYLIWILPLLLPYLIRGIDAIRLTEAGKKSLFISFIFFQLAGYPVFVQNYVVACGRMQPLIKEIKQVETFVPDIDKIAVNGGSGIKYFHPDWHVINIGGVTSPHFRDCKDTAMRVKKIAHSPDLQFGVFFTHDLDRISLREIIDGDSIVFEVPHPYRSPLYIFPVNWEKICSSDTPLDPNVLRELTRFKLADKLDIAYASDERRCRYEHFSLYSYGSSLPFLSACPTNKDTTTFDAARGILGWDRFTFQTIPQREHWLVVRSLIKADVLFRTFDGKKNLTINTRQIPQLLLQIESFNRLSIDWQNLISKTDSNVLEWIVKIPGHLIQEEKTTFSLLGDHIVCDYWLYVSDKI